MYYSYVEIEYIATSFSPARLDLALKLLTTWLGIPIFGSNFWDSHCKQNSNSVFDSKDSGRFFFQIPMSGESENQNSDLRNLEFR
jgi:hypothetical protein